MFFEISVVKLINILFIAAGIGICGLCFLQMASAIHIRKEVRRYFQVFFSPLPDPVLMNSAVPTVL